MSVSMIDPCSINTELTFGQVLLERLAAVEKKLAELELKHSSTSLAEAALALKNESDTKENAPAVDAALESKTDDKTSTSTPLFPISDSSGFKGANEEKDEGPASRVKVVVNRTDPETGEPIEEDSKQRKSKDTDIYRDKYAFILRKKVYEIKYTTYPARNSSEVDITSLDLWNLLKEHLGHYPYHIFRDSPVTLSSP